MATAHPSVDIPTPATDGAGIFRVVIVEDSPLVARRIEEAVTDISGVVVVATATSEAEARTVLGACRWDFLILDLQLRDGNGLNVLRSLQNDAQAASRQIAVVTTFASTACARESLALGASYFFDKAHDLPALVTLIRKLVAKAPQFSPA
jgi:DNA-binding NarL/FixJ family response regulator